MLSHFPKKKLSIFLFLPIKTTSDSDSIMTLYGIRMKNGIFVGPRNKNGFTLVETEFRLDLRPIKVESIDPGLHSGPTKAQFLSVVHRDSRPAIEVFTKKAAIFRKNNSQKSFLQI
jgi:hypothetical protein